MFTFSLVFASAESALAVLPSTPTKTPPKREQLTPQKLQPCRHVLSPKKVPHKENEENFILKSPKKPLPKLQIAKQDSKYVALCVCVCVCDIVSCMCVNVTLSLYDIVLCMCIFE